MKRLYAGGWIVVCDDAGTEHPSGWLLVEDGVVGAAGAGGEPDADDCSSQPSRRAARPGAAEIWTPVQALLRSKKAQ